MYIKNYFIIILFLCTFLQVRATGLSGDIISFNGETWILMAKPINMDSILYKRLMDFIPDNHCISTANWDGYTAFWEIRDNYLCLQRMEVYVHNEERTKDSTIVYDAEALQTLFAPYYKDGRIQARWLSGELRAGKGEFVRYVHTGFDRNMETERVLYVKNGQVVKTATYSNFKKNGLKITNAHDEIIRRLPWKRFPEYKGQRILLILSNFQMTDDGHFKDCKISAILQRPPREDIKDDNHPLIIALKETLKDIYPWEIMFINGQYTIGYTSLSISILEKYLVAHTNEKQLEVGVPVCYLNERGDTIVPYGKYRFCQTDTIRSIGFVYENGPNAKIVCIDAKGRKLFSVFKYDNGVDYAQGGLFRIVDDKGLLGFADTLGNIVIQPQYKFAFPFKNGKAKVTLSGESKEVPDSNGECGYWESKEWFYIDKENNRLSETP